MANNRKFKPWEWLIVVWMFLSELAHNINYYICENKNNCSQS